MFLIHHRQSLRISLRQYYNRLFSSYVFTNNTAEDTASWRCLDVGSGTGFLEMVLKDIVGELWALDATYAMLEMARRKDLSKQVHWLQGEALKLPFKKESFDLVCSNALLHHVANYEDVLEGMVSLIKPGGKIFLGYEPNSIPYKLFQPLLLLLAAIVPEQRNKERIRLKSQQDIYPQLKGVDIHKLSEFHIFHGKGISTSTLKKTLTGWGIVDIRVHYSSVFQATLLKDSGIPLPIDSLPEWLYRLTGPLSLSFSLTGTRSSEGN